MVTLILVFLTSFVVVLYSTPALIRVSILKRLFDEPGERKIHSRVVPTVGGILIFAATIFSFSLWFYFDSPTVSGNVSEEMKFYSINKYMTEFKLIIASSIVLFFVGIKDDIIGTAPIKKLVAHVVVGLILVLIGDLRITGLHGIFGVYDIPYWGSVFISLFTYIVVVNAFNLIDGVDGLAGGVGLITSISFGTWFILCNDYVYASLAFSLAGSLAAFLIFNFNPAKIFMGDSGSLTIGLIVCILSIKVIEYPVENITYPLVLVSKPVFVISTLVYPLADTLRVFILRAAKGISPFAADRNHLHHKILDSGVGHRGAVLIIYFFNLMVISLCVLTGGQNPSLALLYVVAFALFALAVLMFFYNRKKKEITPKLEK